MDGGSGAGWRSVRMAIHLSPRQSRHQDGKALSNCLDASLQPVAVANFRGGGRLKAHLCPVDNVHQARITQGVGDVG